MFKILKQLTLPTNKDIRRRIYFTFFALFIFVIGCNIRVPGTRDFTSELGFFELLTALGGGSLRRFSIFGLGVMPYITAEIIMELLQMDIVPYFSELKKQGPVGRLKITKIGRYLGILIAFVQGIVFSYILGGQLVTPGKSLFIALVLTGGTAFLMWLGDQITLKGLGNGISLLIMAGIVFNMPFMFMHAVQDLTAHKGLFGILTFIGFVLLYLAVVIGVVYVQEAERRVPIKYVNKTTNFDSEAKSFMPFKINGAGVIPVIFASSLLAIPLTFAQFKHLGPGSFIYKYFDYSSSTFALLLFAFLIFMFSFFYVYIQVKPEELAKNLNEGGGFIPGVRPGKETENYVTTMLSRITFLGGLFISFIAILPIIFNRLSGLPRIVTIGGTGLLIVVGVALETYKQLEGSLIARNYKKGRARK